MKFVLNEVNSRCQVSKIETFLYRPKLFFFFFLVFSAEKAQLTQLLPSKVFTRILLSELRASYSGGNMGRLRCIRSKPQRSDPGYGFFEFFFNRSSMYIDFLTSHENFFFKKFAPKSLCQW